MCQRASVVPTTISLADQKTWLRLFFVATAQSTLPFRTQNLSGIRLSGGPGHRRSHNHSYLDIERYYRDHQQKGGDEIEGIDLLEATGNRSAASGSNGYLA